MAAAHILIVEDDARTRDLLNILLRANGYEAAYAADAYGAVAAARRRRPDAVLLDFSLPGGDGLVVLERLRRLAELATVPVLVITARDREPTERLALAAGAVGFLQKPFEPHELLTLLAEALSVPVRRADGAGTVFSTPG